MLCYRQIDTADPIRWVTFREFMKVNARLRLDNIYD